MKKYRTVIGAVVMLGSLILAGCERSDQNLWQGYVEGEFVNVATSVAGRLDRIAVARGDQVGVDTLLFVLQHDYEMAAYKVAQAQLERASAQQEDLLKGKRPQEVAVTEAQLRQAQVEADRAVLQLKRDEAQFQAGGISRQQLDDSYMTDRVTQARVEQLQAELNVSRLPGRNDQIQAQSAEVAAARAAVAQAKWNLDQATVISSRAGQVVDVLQQPGEWIASGRPVVRMLPPENIKIRFFVPQPVLGRLQVGETVKIRCDGCPNDWRATISFISPEAEYTPPIIYSNETRSKLVFMIEARPELQIASRLHPGQPVSVMLN